MYKKLKKQNGEKFAQTIRDFHNGILEIPDLDVILRHAGRDAEPLLPYLMGLLAPKDDTSAPASGDPFVLLDQAGYDAFVADTLERQNSIQRYFARGELLCTFNDNARYEKYHIVHAVKKDVSQINRADFRGREARQDEYGTSVISIQMLKEGGFISIKNRYNHAVDNCDNTFGSNPDNIVKGLSAALKKHFDVEFSAPGCDFPEGFIMIGSQVFKYHKEDRNVHYGDQAWGKDGVVHEVNRSAGDAMFDGFVFDNKTKTLSKIDPDYDDNFAYDFNRLYGGNRALCVKDGNLTLNGKVLISAEKSRIKTLDLPALTSMSYSCLRASDALEGVNAPALVSMGHYCLFNADNLKHFHAPVLATMGDSCLHHANALIQFDGPALVTMGNGCFNLADSMTSFNAPVLTSMGNKCFHHASAITVFKAPSLTAMGNLCLCVADALKQFEAPALITMGHHCLHRANALPQFNAPVLTAMGNNSLSHAKTMTQFKVPLLTGMGTGCLVDASALTLFNAPKLLTMGNLCLCCSTALTNFDAPVLTVMGNKCLHHANSLMLFKAPALASMGDECLHYLDMLAQFDGPSLVTMGEKCLYYPDVLTVFKTPKLISMGDSCLCQANASLDFYAPVLTEVGYGCLAGCRNLNIVSKTRHAEPALA